MERAKEAVWDEVEAPKSVASSSMDVAPESSVAQKAVVIFHAFLVELEDLDDVFVPVNDEELTKFVRSLEMFKAVSGEQEKQGRHYIHLDSLSTKLYHGVCQCSMVKMKQVGQSMKEFFSQLEEAITLQIESHALAAVCSVTQFLKDICLGLMPGIHSLPDNIQELLHQIKNNIEDVQASFSAATSFQDFSSNALSQIRERVSRAKECLDVLLEYLIQNTPLKRHVGVIIPSEYSLKKEEEG